MISSGIYIRVIRIETCLYVIKQYIANGFKISSIIINQLNFNVFLVNFLLKTFVLLNS